MVVVVFRINIVINIGPQQWNACITGGNLRGVFLREQLDQTFFFIGDASMKKGPRHNGKQYGTHDIPRSTNWDPIHQNMNPVYDGYCTTE
jgi:hypothetical protein